MSFLTPNSFKKVFERILLTSIVIPAEKANFANKYNN